MRHKTAARRGDDGWHYVSMGDHGGHPLGRCASHPPHATEAEARECYSRFVREDTIRLDASSCGWTSCKADRCPEPTQAVATYGDDGYGVVALCPRHMTVDQVVAAAQLDRPAGDAWVS